MSNGSIIGRTNPTFQNFKSAGVWTLSEHFNLYKSGSWPGGDLYAFTSVLFNAGLDASPSAPTKQNIIDNITSTSLSSFQNNTDYFDVTNGIITWKVPGSGNYRIVAKGAAGGQSINWGPQGGFGAIMTGDFSLQAQTVLKILVGQRGQSNTYDGGGGGGTFVTLLDNTPLIVAGGGGGGSASGFNGSAPNSKNANLLTAGYSTAYGSGGTNGSGGAGSTAGGGGGLTGNGTGSWFGTSFTNGGLGGGPQAAGGFGGGGGGGGTNGAGGGGGYSGGAYASWSYEAAGGGSYNNGTNPTAVLNTVYEKGSVTITKL
jgi:hypothetical protein